MSTNEVAKSFSEGASVVSTSGTNCDDGACAPQIVTSTAAIAVDDMLCMYFSSSERSKNSDSQLDGMEAVILKSALAKHFQGTLDRFFQRQ